MSSNSTLLQFETRLEQEIGSRGLRIKRIFTKGRNKDPFKKIKWQSYQSKEGVTFQIPDTWEKIVGSFAPYIAERLTDKGEESSVKDLIQEICSQWRWWGDSYSYFNRKIDAITYQQELEYTLVHRLVSPNLLQWQYTGLKLSEIGSDNWFIDPETEDAKQIAAPNYRTSTLQNLDSQIENLPASAQFSTAYIEPANFYEQSTKKFNWEQYKHMVRLLAITLDITILMSKYPSQAKAEETHRFRPITLHLLAENTLPETIPSITNAIVYSTSAQLAKLHESYSGFEEMKESVTSYIDNKAQSPSFDEDQVEWEYAKALGENYGFRNSVLPPTAPDPAIVNFLREDKGVIELELTPKKKPAPPSKKPTLAKPKEEAKAVPEEVTEQIEQPIEEAVKPVEKVKPKVPEAKPIEQVQQPEPPELPPDTFKSITHKFKLDNASGYITARLDENDKPIFIILQAHKVDPLVNNQLATISHLVNLLLEKNAGVEEICEELKGTTFYPKTSEFSSILDYISKWLLQL